MAFLAAILADAVQRRVAVAAAPLELRMRYVPPDRVFVHLCARSAVPGNRLAYANPMYPKPSTNTRLRITLSRGMYLLEF